MATNQNNGVWANSQNNPYPQSEFLDKQTNRPTRAWQQFFLGILNFTSASTATSGQSSVSLPANPVGFINITVNGQPYKVPYYNL
jgi:hypothetical protein